MPAASVDHTPDACLRCSSMSSSAPAPGRMVARSACTDTAGPNRSRAWSTRCGPRSSSVPPPCSGVPPCQLDLSGRNRSMLDVNRCTVPSSPSSISRRTVRKSLSQRRFWYGTTTRPARSACSTISPAAAAVRPNGLSTTACSPASRARCATSAWVPDGVVIVTASTPSAARSPRPSTHSTPGASSAPAPPLGRAVTTATSSTPGADASSGRWKIRPPPPYPTSAQRTASSVRRASVSPDHPAGSRSPCRGARAGGTGLSVAAITMGHRDGSPHRARRPRAQFAERRHLISARCDGRLHRSVRFGQVLPGVRHHLRRGPATLRRVAVRVRPAVPRADGQAGRRLHRGPLAGRVDRPEVDLPQPAVDGRHHHRDLRLPPAAASRGSATRTAPSAASRSPADAAADRRPGAGDAGGHAVPDPRAGRARAEGRVRGPVRRAAVQGLRPGPHRRRRPPAQRPAEAEEAGEALHRGGRRPPRHPAHREAAAHRLDRDRAEARRRRGDPRVRRPRRGRPGSGAPLLGAARLPERPPARHRRARAAVVLLQLPVRGLPGVHRSRHAQGGRPRARRARRRAVARAGRHPALGGRHHQRVLRAAAAGTRGAGRLLRRHPVGPAARDAPARRC